MRLSLYSIGLVLAISVSSFGDEISFNRDIRPLLSNHCFACHGPDSKHREADLRLDVEEDAKADAIVAGNPDKSELIARIFSDDDDARMPPPELGKDLTETQKDLLKRWIAEGANYEPHWAYVKPKRAPAPELSAEVVAATRPLGEIDRFLFARLIKENLSPSKPTDQVTLIRRLSFDLTGLPPTPSEVDAFVNDTSPKAYEKLVDRLLASPRYGERMAVVWLDLVRYADTVGYHGDQDQNIAPYRDYVITSFNENMPFDQFTREQLAGDLLPQPTTSQLVASGYNRLLQTSHEGGVQPKEYIAIYAADRVRNVSAVWMGATVGCAQCHDHKFDPYTAKDFYSLAAFFDDLDDTQHFKSGTNSLPTRREPEISVPGKDQATKVAELDIQIEAVIAKVKVATKEEKPELEKLLKELQTQRQNIVKTFSRTMISKPLATPRVTRILPRGNWLDDSGPIVQPAIPEFLGSVHTVAQDKQGNRATRLDLANWLTSAEGGGPLTARVMANRLWAICFGSALAADLDDFGGQGEPPVHPELLDYLAMELLESDWNMKALLKQMVMSQAYRQSSVSTPKLRDRDPLNRLYARQSRFRLPAEMVRDNALAASGLLVNAQGGPSVKPYQPPGYYRHLNFPTRKYSAHSDDRQWRRGVYVHWQRQFLHPMLKAFDAPSREECTAERPQSNTPLAALTLLNDPTFIEAARVLAESSIRDGGDSFNSRLDMIYRKVVSRTPDSFERDVLKTLYDSSKQQYEKDPTAAKNVISIGLKSAASGLDPAEVAGWTTVSRAVLNSNETITRN